MLKKIKIGSMGIVLMVILLITMTALNIGIVNANTIDKNNASHLKFVTKQVPGYGNVTAREDMFVGDGDNVTVVLNKDYNEIGVITPKIEKLPREEFISIDTPYGKINVTPDTYKTLGREKIIENQKKFMEQRNEANKMGMASAPGSSNITGQSADTAIAQVQIKPSIAIQSEGSTFTREDWAFVTKPGYSPNSLWGQIYPLSDPYVSNDIASYHELEINFNSPGEVLEVIAQQHGDQRDVWACMWDDHYPKGIVYHPFNGITGPIEYHVFEDTQAGGLYIIFYNPATNVMVLYHFTDSTVGSTITWIDASSELTYPGSYPTLTFRTDSRSEQWAVGQRNVSKDYYPTEVFDNKGRSSDNKYVSVSAVALNGHYIVTHSCGSQVA